MIDARQFIRNKLMQVCENVKVVKPDGNVTLPLICYTQTENAPSLPAAAGLYARIGWRIACYASSFDELRKMVDDVDGVMSGELGFTRTHASSDESARIGVDLYLCRLDYSGLVNEITHEIIRKSS